jgi:hypothetical protein
MSDESLVQNEGVNAGSAKQLDEVDREPAGQPTGSVPSAGDVRAGGHAEDAEPEVDDLDPSGPGSADPDDAELLGAPDEQGGRAGRPSGSSGQDAGSME